MEWWRNLATQLPAKQYVLRGVRVRVPSTPYAHVAELD